MSRATFDKQVCFKWGKTKLTKSSHCMARLPESIWLSLPRMADWIFKTAKLPPLIVTAFDKLTKSWATNIYISGENVSY